MALVQQGLCLDFIGSDETDSPKLHGHPSLRYLNLHGGPGPKPRAPQRFWVYLTAYARLMAYAARATPKVFHVLWNPKFQLFDRTVLMLYYRLLGKKIVFTAHNVNAGQRDNKDGFLNRLTLRIQYRLADGIFVHTQKMKQQLSDDFRVPPGKVTVIPYGINNAVPDTSLTSAEAKARLGFSPSDRVLLLFGRVTAYKGVEYAVRALAELPAKGKEYRLVIAGRIKGCPEYWAEVQEAIAQAGVRPQIIERTKFIADEEIEIFFKAADALLLPYTEIFQSGILFLGYSFGLPVVAADVGSFKEEIREGETGFICKPKDVVDLARAIEKYFASDLYRQLDVRREAIRVFARERCSWDKVAALTANVYSNLPAR
jgi:glycosyltransferase involved in cell wall biosynthesis